MRRWRRVCLSLESNSLCRRISFFVFMELCVFKVTSLIDVERRVHQSQARNSCGTAAPPPRPPRPARSCPNRHHNHEVTNSYTVHSKTPKSSAIDSSPSHQEMASTPPCVNPYEILSLPKPWPRRAGAGAQRHSVSRPPKVGGDRQPPPTAGSRCAMTLSPLPALGNRRRSRRHRARPSACRAVLDCYMVPRGPLRFCSGGFWFLDDDDDEILRPTGTSFCLATTRWTRLGDGTAGLFSASCGKHATAAAQASRQRATMKAPRRHSDVTFARPWTARHGRHDHRHTTCNVGTQVDQIKTMIKFSTTTTRSHLVSFASRNTIQARKPTTKRNPTDHL